MAEPVSAAIAAIVTGLTKAGVAVGLSKAAATAAATFTVKAVAAVGLSVAANTLMAPRVGAQGNPLEWQADPDAGIPFVCGRRGVAGLIVHRDAYGPDRRWQSIVTVYSGAGPVQGFSTTPLVDDEALTFSGESPASGKYSQMMWRQTRLGAQPDTALTSPAGLSASLPGWTSDHKLSGKAATMITLQQDSKFATFPGGVEPKFIEVIEGIIAYDWRLDSTFPGGDGPQRIDDRSTWAYSANAAVHAVNWAMGLWENGKKVAGIGAGPDEDGVERPTLRHIDIDAFTELANINDTNGWTVSARFTSKDDKHQVLLAFLQAAGAIYCKRAGKISCIPRANIKTSILTLTANDTAGPLELDTSSSRRIRFNFGLPSCPLETHKWETVPLEPVTSSVFVEEDGGESRERGVDFKFVSDGEQASQLMGLDIADSREPFTARLPLKPHLRELKPGDAFTFTEPGFYLDGVKFVVLDRDFDPASSRVTVTIRSLTDGYIEWALGLIPEPPSPPSLTAPDPSVFPQPPDGDWAAAAGTGEGADGEETPTLVLTGEVSLPRAARVVVETRTRLPDGESWGEWSAWRRSAEADARAERIEVTGLPAGAQVEASLVYVSDLGAPSETPRVLAPVTLGDLVSSNTRNVGDRTAAAVNQAIDDAEDASRDARRRIVEATQRTALLAAALREEVSRRADDDGAIRLTLFDVEATADGARAAAQSILTLSADPGSAFAIWQTGITASVEGLEDEFEAGGRVTLAEASINTLTGALATLERSTAFRFEDFRATLATTLAALSQEIIVTAETNAASVLRINRAEAGVAQNRASFFDILELNVDPDSAFALRLTSIEARFAGTESSSLATQTQLTEAISDVYGAEVTSFTNITARFETVEGDVSDLEDEFGEGGRVTEAEASITTLFDASATATRARARAFESLLANLASTLSSIQSLREVIADENSASALRVDRTAAELNGVSGLVETMASVFIDEAGAVAAWLNRVTAGDATATIEMVARDENGDPVSNIRLRADRIGFGTGVEPFFEYIDEDPEYDDEPNIYLRDRNGEVILDGRALARPWVAREPQLVQKQDGESVVFERPFTDIPRQIVQFNGLAPLDANEKYDVTLENWDVDDGLIIGAEMRAKIIPASSLVSVESTSTGSFGDSDFSIERSEHTNAYDGNFQFRVSGAMQVENVDGIAEGWIDIDIAVFLVGTGESDRLRVRLSRGDVGIAFNAASGTYGFTNVTFTRNIPGDFVDGTQAVHFLLYLIAQQHGTATVSAFNRVIYTKATTGSERSATPGSEVATIYVLPPV